MARLGVLRRGRIVAGLLLLALAAPTVAEIRFRRVDRARGLDFRHHHGGSGRYYMVETDGGGVALFDFDADGDLDVFLVDGGILPGYRGETPRSRLLRNDGGGRFVDHTAASGIAHSVYGSGVAAGDVDGDGDLDLYLTAFGRNQLWSNAGDGTFTEVGAAAGVDDPLWGSAAAFADVDRDGDLDLYLVNYVSFTLEHNLACGDQSRGLRGYCGPDVYDGLPDRFYQNRGDGTFVDRTEAAGFAPADGAGLALTFADLDGDGWVDLYVANDVTPNFLYHGRGDGTFVERGLLSGTAYGPRGLAEAGMGVAVGDYDGDGLLDFVVTNYEGETNALFHNRGSLLFHDRRFASGLAEPTLRQLAFGVAAGDLDHDGDLDLVFANGHVRENAALFDPLSSYRQPNQVFENLGPESGGPRFREVESFAALTQPGPSRGLAAGDLDGDGDLDLVVTNVDERAEVYENLLPAGDGWLLVDLRGRRNRFAVGARLEVEIGVRPTGDRRLVREVRAGESYMSQHSLTVHFGLGGAPKVDLPVRWPEGGRRTIRGLAAGRRIVCWE